MKEFFRGAAVIGLFIGVVYMLMWVRGCGQFAEPPKEPASAKAEAKCLKENDPVDWQEFDQICALVMEYNANLRVKAREKCLAETKKTTDKIKRIKSKLTKEEQGYVAPYYGEMNCNHYDADFDMGNMRASCGRILYRFASQGR